MKKCNLAGFFLAASVLGTQAQTANTVANPLGASGALPAPTAFQVVESGANHRTWQRKTFELGPNGKILTRFHQFQELSSGMNYLNSNNQWTESQETIQPTSAGAIAQQGQYQVMFANNLNSTGAIDIKTPDQKDLVNNVLGLAYYDASSGNSVVIAQIQDSQGELIAANQVLYPNAFNGVNADVRYTYHRSGFEQDVILRGQPATPRSLGLNPETTEIEVISEFIHPPAAAVRDHSTARHPTLDQDISWGSMFAGQGKAFDLGQPADFPGIKVIKKYVTLQGRQILLERVPWMQVQRRISQLPLTGSIQKRGPVMVTKVLRVPKAPGLRSAKSPIKWASAKPSDKGYVLDYYFLVNTSPSDFTFQADQTYLISSNVNFSGTTTFEGGTVIKYVDGNSCCQLWGPAVCKASSYTPIIMTSVNDSSVGENIGSGGALSYNNAFSMADWGGDVEMEHMRISYAEVGVHPTCNNFRLKDVQLINCGKPICPEYVDCQINNALIVNASNVFWGGQYTVQASHFTVDGCQQFTAGWDDSSDDSITFTNSLWINIGSFGYATMTTNYTVQLPSDSGVFQAVGGGGYYLAANSPFRAMGTTNIDPEFLADISTKTTYPPIFYFFPGYYCSQNMNLSAQAQRDSVGNPDIGFHYDCLDYLFGPTFLTNATITFNAGTAVGFYGSNAPCGITTGTNGNVICVGTANNINHVVEYNTVQESTPAHWIEPDYALIGNFASTNTTTVCRFTDWSVMALDAHTYQTQIANSPVAFQDCQFHGGFLESDITSISFTNCLLDRVWAILYPYDSTIPSFRNNTICNGTFDFEPNSTNSVIFDNLFDGASLPDGLGAADLTYIGGHNAYVTNANTLDPTHSGDVILANSPDYQISWYGDRYLPSGSPLLNAGSTTADHVGLYHFTTQTSQTPETNSIVDIGYHYVATDAYGNPLNTNGDGTPDYLEDANGNGLVDSGEIGWNIIGDLGLQIIISQPRNGASVP